MLHRLQLWWNITLCAVQFPPMAETVITLGRYVTTIHHFISLSPVSPRPSVTCARAPPQLSGRRHQLLSCCMWCMLPRSETDPDNAFFSFIILFYSTAPRCRYGAWFWCCALSLSCSQNINQLEIFGDMSTPPDITSPSVSSRYTPLHSSFIGGFKNDWSGPKWNRIPQNTYVKWNKIQINHE